MSETPVNFTRTAAGLVRAVCQCCGRESRAAKPQERGEPNLWAIGRGWSTAPFPPRCVHSDGSSGSTFTCPACNKRLHAGETLQLRAYAGGLLRMREVG